MIQVFFRLYSIIGYYKGMLNIILLLDIIQMLHQFSSVQFSCSVMSNSLQPHESQHAMPPCPSPTPRVHSDSCPLNQWCHATISSSIPSSPSALSLFHHQGLFQWVGKDSDAGRDWGQEKKGTTEDEMAGWHHWLDGLESEWTAGVGDGQGGLACCDSWGHKESDTTERLNWTDL